MQVKPQVNILAREIVASRWEMSRLRRLLGFGDVHHPLVDETLRYLDYSTCGLDYQHHRYSLAIIGYMPLYVCRCQ